LGKRGGNLWQGRKRKLNETVEIVESVKTSVLSFSKCEFPVTGRRVVELDLLAKELDGGCKSCGKPLRLADCTQETISGLLSFLYMTCGEESCGEINVCHTSKVNMAAEYSQSRGKLNRCDSPFLLNKHGDLYFLLHKNIVHIFLFN